MSEANSGEFRDSECYTHLRVAQILGVGKDWVIRRMIRDPNGIRFRKVGNYYLISGQDIRFWIERGGRFYHEGRVNDDSDLTADDLALGGRLRR